VGASSLARDPTKRAFSILGRVAKWVGKIAMPRNLIAGRKTKKLTNTLNFNKFCDDQSFQCMNKYNNS